MGLFAEWSSLNKIICDWRLRFDECRVKLDQCTTREEAVQILKEEGYETRYPVLPTWLK